MMRIAPIHPFPARMAPEIAISELAVLEPGATVLDPMMGSGTVLRHAVSFGHRAVGFDMDPLAVLMSRVWSTPVSPSSMANALTFLDAAIARVQHSEVALSWIDNDPETTAFVAFWFGDKQQRDLRRLAYAIDLAGSLGNFISESAVDVLRTALSRIIITKKVGASLAWDVSHSRPHRVMQSSDFEVIPAFKRSLDQLIGRIAHVPKNSSVKASLGDARDLKGVRRESADVVLTSPPYLNAIDYMRGHKLSLIWLGYTVRELREIRSGSVGAERRSSEELTEASCQVQMSMVDGASLETRHLSMVERYAIDLVKGMAQTARVLKPSGLAVFVVGNSCLRNTFIRNSAGVIRAAQAAGLSLMNETVRKLPESSRYLPIPNRSDLSSWQKNEN